MPDISAYADSRTAPEDQTLLLLYSLAGEKEPGFIGIDPRIFRRIEKILFPAGTAAASAFPSGPVLVRELSPAEMVRAEKELWTHYHGQKADPAVDRLFAAFVGSRLVGVARCSRHTDGLEVDAVYVLEDSRRRGYARSIMALLIEECGRNDTLYMHSRRELTEFYGSFGFRAIRETDLPRTIRDRFGFCLGNLDGIEVCPMKRDPPACIASENA